MRRVRRFKWIEWNVSKVAAHGLATDEVEAVFDSVLHHRCRPDGAFESHGRLPSGRGCWVIWRWDEDLPSIFSDLGEQVVFVITAYPV